MKSCMKEDVEYYCSYMKIKWTDLTITHFYNLNITKTNRCWICGQNEKLMLRIHSFQSDNHYSQEGIGQTSKLAAFSSLILYQEDQITPELALWPVNFNPKQPSNTRWLSYSRVSIYAHWVIVTGCSTRAEQMKEQGLIWEQIIIIKFEQKTGRGWNKESHFVCTAIK